MRLKLRKMKRRFAEKPFLLLIIWGLMIFGVFLVLLGGYHLVLFLLSLKFKFLSDALAAICAGILLLRSVWLLHFNLFSTYSICGSGLEIDTPFFKKVVHPWSEFQEICICYEFMGDQTAGRSIFCFVKHGEKHNIYGRWKTDHLFRWHRLIHFDYQPEMHQALQHFCPYPVRDLRGTGNYKITHSQFTQK